MLVGASKQGATNLNNNMPGKKSSAKESSSSKKSGAKKSGAKKSGARKVSSKRELITLRSDSRYIRRDAKGRIKESDDASRSLKQDRARKAKTKVKSGQGDRRDR